MGETRGKYLFTVLHIVNMFFIRFLILIMLLILDEWMKEKSEKILMLCIVNIVSTQGVQAKHTHVNQLLETETIILKPSITF